MVAQVRVEEPRVEAGKGSLGPWQTARLTGDS